MRLGRALLSITWLLAACGGRFSFTTSTTETTLDTVAGVVHVHNSGMAPAWRTEPVLRLGSIEGGPQEFGRIRSLIADEDGSIYVADNLAHEIRVFGPDGRHLRSIGRRGAGPGEFGDLYALAWLAGDLAAMDPRNARIAVLSRHGVVKHDIRYFPITGPPSLIRLHPLSGDAFYAPVIDMDRQALPIVRFDSIGAQDTIPAPQIPPGERLAGVLCHRPDGGITSISMPESPGIVYAFPPPGGIVAVSWTQHYRIAFLGLNGDTMRVVTRERAAAPYTDELWEAGMRPYRELRETFPSVRCEPAVPERPRHRAALRHMLFDETGQMWVEAAAEDGFAWEVFGADGRLLGSAPAPSRASAIPPYVRNGHLYQVEVGDMDVQYVAVYRVHSQD
jgi:hypothetical protein